MTPTALTVTTTIENRGAVAMPFGFGQHPWFEREADVELRFDAGAFWIEGWDNIASERIATPPELAFTEWRRLPRARRNNCYGGWDGRAEIRWPSRKIGLRIDAEPVFRHLMLFTDPRPKGLLPRAADQCGHGLQPDGRRSGRRRSRRHHPRARAKRGRVDHLHAVCLRLVAAIAAASSLARVRGASASAIRQPEPSRRRRRKRIGERRRCQPVRWRRCAIGSVSVGLTAGFRFEQIGGQKV